MFVYAYWTKDGNQFIQAFHKAERATQYVIDQIYSLVAAEEKRYVGKFVQREVPPELPLIKKKISEVQSTLSFDDAVGLIELYEEYVRYVLGQDTPMHTLKNIQVVE